MAEITRQQLILALAATPSEREGIHGRLAGVDLSGLDLSRLNLSRLDLSRASFKGCRLVEANFDHSCANDADFTGADLSGAYLHCMAAFDARFVRAALRKVDAGLMDAERADLTEADLTGACLVGGDFALARFRRAKLIDVQMSGVALAKNDWIGAQVSGGDWSELRGFDRDPLHLPFEPQGFSVANRREEGGDQCVRPTPPRPKITA